MPSFMASKGFLKIDRNGKEPVESLKARGRCSTTRSTGPRSPEEKAKADAKKKRNPSKSSSLLKALVRAIGSGLIPDTPRMSQSTGPRYTVVTADATNDYRPVKVRSETNCHAAFWPALQAGRHGRRQGSKRQVSLEMCAGVGSPARSAKT